MNNTHWYSEQIKSLFIGATPISLGLFAEAMASGSLKRAVISGATTLGQAALALTRE